MLQHLFDTAERVVCVRDFYQPRYTITVREWDGDADLYYYRARWYDAGVGRFVSEDPIGFESNWNRDIQWTEILT